MKVLSSSLALVACLVAIPAAGCSDDAPPASFCGDGILGAGEVCDDGNVVDGDLCSSDCRSNETCGNGIVDSARGEQCDGGDAVAGDGCSDACKLEYCGNGVTDPDEICDDGGNLNGDGCSADCLSSEACGNGVVDRAIGEACDDGNAVDGDGCSASCGLPGCGDGVTDAGEACDDGNAVGGDGCSAACTSNETCGNAVVDAGEACDDGNVAGADGCSSVCQPEFCGNGVDDPGEVCDDGNVTGGDGCSANCNSNETCGNGLRELAEECDDGNAAAGDGCTRCALDPYCGDGDLDPGEGCDDGNNDSIDGCNLACIVEATCGDGVLDPGEQCDDSNLAPGDGCDQYCTRTVGCDSFTAGDSTTVSGWTERAGDWLVDANRLRNSVPDGIYSNVITKDGSWGVDGCARLTAILTPPGSLQAVGVVLRWTSPNTYIVALVQDNSSGGAFDSAFIYEYPAFTQIGALSGVALGSSPNIEACVSGSTVTLRVDAAQDGTYEAALAGTTTIATPGLIGVMTHTTSSFSRVDDVCWGP